MSRVQRDVDKEFAAADATGIPQNSPLAITNNVEVNLVKPHGSRNIIMRANVAIRIKRTSGGTPYYQLVAESTITLGIEDMTNIYILPEATGTLQFAFTGVSM